MAIINMFEEGMLARVEARRKRERRREQATAATMWPTMGWIRPAVTSPLPVRPRVMFQGHTAQDLLREITERLGLSNQAVASGSSARDIVGRRRKGR